MGPLGDRRLHSRPAKEPVLPDRRIASRRRVAARKYPSAMTTENNNNLAWSPQRLIFAALGLGSFLVAVGWMMSGGASSGSAPNGAFITQFFRSYLVAWFFWWAIAIGSLVLLLLHNLTGGAWGFAIRPILLAAAGT